MREYGTVHSAFWTSDDISGLSDQAKILALYLLTGPHSTITGCFRLPLGYVSDDLGWDSETVIELFSELFAKGFATRDEPSKYVFIHRFLKWNRIENPNQGKAAAKAFHQIPDSTPLKPLLAKALLEFSKHLKAEDLNCSETLSKPFRNQEQEQEQEQKQQQEQEQEHTPDKRAASLRAADLVSLGVAEQVAKDFLAVRKAKRAPLTHTALTAITAEAGKAGVSLSDALSVCAARGWQSFRADWVAAGQKPDRHSGFADRNYHEGVNPDGSF